MDVLLNSYSNLKTLAIEKYASNVVGNIIVIDTMKGVYAEVINSPRMLSQVSDLAALIRVLEKRDALSPVNIDAFNYIYDGLRLNPKHLEKHYTLVAAEGNCFRSTYEDEVETQLPSRDSSGYNRVNNLNHSIPTNETPFMTQGMLSERVIKTVCSQIGNSWKKLARFLDVVQEDTIERIEEDRRITSHEVRARMILDEYQRNVDPSDVKEKLLKALRFAERMDIHDQIQKMFLREMY